jgi:hypothetical protein
MNFVGSIVAEITELEFAPPKTITAKYNSTFNSILSGGNDTTITLTMNTYNLSQLSTFTSNTELQVGGAIHITSTGQIFKVASVSSGNYTVEEQVWFKYKIGDTRMEAISSTNYLTIETAESPNAYTYNFNQENLCDLTGFYDVLLNDTVGTNYNGGFGSLDKYITDGIDTRGAALRKISATRWAVYFDYFQVSSSFNACEPV